MNIDYSKKYPQVKKVSVSTMFEYKDKVAYSVDAFGNVPESIIQELKDNHPFMVYEQTKCGQDHYRDIIFFDSREDIMLYLYEESEAASNQAYEVYNVIGEGSAIPVDGKDCLGMNYDRLMNGVVPARSEGVETTYQIRDCKTGEVVSYPTWTEVNTEAFLLIDAVFDERAKKTLAKRAEFNKTADALRENTRKLYDLPEGTYAKVKAVNYRCDNFESYYTGYVAVNRSPVDDDGYWSLRVLNVESVNKGNNTFGGRDPVEGDYLSVYSSDLFVEEIIGKDHPDFDKCEFWQHEFKQLHDNAPYEIRGSIYSITPDNFGRYEEVESKTWTPEDVHSLEDAEKWLMTNHPEYYFGASIAQKCVSGNFMGIPVPYESEPEQRTLEGRLAYVKALYERKYGAKDRQLIEGAPEDTADKDRDLGDE